MGESTVSLVITADSTGGSLTVAAIRRNQEATFCRGTRAASVPRVLDAFLEFLRDSVCVVYDRPACERLLGRDAAARLPRAYDCLDLARILLPDAPDFSLDAVAGVLGIEEPAETGALRAARTLEHTWRVLLRQLASLPPAVLRELVWATGDLLSPLGDVIRQAESQVRQKSQVDGRRYEQLIAARPELTRYRAFEGKPKEGLPEGIESEAVAGRLGPGGEIAAALPGYETRRQQLEMSQAVAHAFSTGTHLMVEAGTGVGKSLGYLVPSILWAKKNSRKVVVSTNTKNLQSQLRDNDLPLLSRAMPESFSFAVIKGRGNYLCLRKLLYLLREAPNELSPAERDALPAVTVWAAKTETGDFAEIAGLDAGRTAPGGERPRFPFRNIRRKLASSAEECLGKSCPYRDRCFLRKARGTAHRADIIVTNHALFFSELGLDQAYLPAAAEVVFDEAHNLEDVATEHLSVRVDRRGLLAPLGRLAGRGVQGGTGGGLVGVIERQLGGGTSDCISAVQSAIKRASAGTDRFLEVLAAVFDSLLAATGKRSSTSSGRGTKGRYSSNEDTVELDGDRTDGAICETVAEAGVDLASNLRAVTDACSLVRTRLKAVSSAPPDEKAKYRLNELVVELEGASARITETAQEVEFATKLEDPGCVYWIERWKAPAFRGPAAGKRRRRRARRTETRGEMRYRLCAAPIDIGRLLHEQLYEKRWSIVFTSATLTVAGSFDFVKSRLGLDRMEKGRVECLSVGTPFNYDRQVKIRVPGFLPFPDAGSRYEEKLAEMLAALFAETGGRGLALFTSYVMLNGVDALLRPRMEAAGIRTLAQGRDGSRESILRAFARDTRSVLLGTASFWEGVDVPGESLSVLVVARLPFQVVGDPIVRARARRVEEEGGNSFTDYQLPMAVLRLKQGIGRLIRLKTDRGVILVADRRVVTRSYGRTFLDSLPTSCSISNSIRELCADAGGFLGAPAATS